MAWTVTPGKPFWSGVVAFSASMVGQFVVDVIDVTTLALTVSFLAAASVSLFVGLVSYGKAKLDELTNGNNDTPPSTIL